MVKKFGKSGGGKNGMMTKSGKGVSKLIQSPANVSKLAGK